MKEIILKLLFLVIISFGKTNLFAQSGDADGDGVLDSDDVCPTLAGTKVNKGCPDENKNQIQTSSTKSFGFVYKTNERDSTTVTLVFEKSPAHSSGINSGDLLQTFNEISVLQKSKNEILEIIKNLPNDNIKIEFKRNGIAKEVTLNKAERSSFANVCLSGNCISGKGIFQDSVGNKYDGYFINGLREGNGKMNYASGNMYNGNWVNNKKNGKGKFLFSGGSEYNGEWKNDTYEGNGKMNYASGNVYDGYWVNNKKNGKGKFSFVDGSEYNGDWKNDVYDGTGEFKWASGNTYNGTWVNNKKSGYGIYTWPNGNIYTGDFLNGKYEGKGNLKFANGDMYVGDFKNEQFYGYGELKKADGTVNKGTWVANVFQDDAIAKSSTNTPNQISREQFNTDAKKYSGSTGDKVAAVKKNSEELNKPNKNTQQDSKNKTKAQDDTNLFAQQKQKVVDKNIDDQVLLPYYDKVSKLYGYINENGVVKITAKFDHANPFANNIAMVTSYKSYPSKYAFINKSGNMLTDFKYTDIAPFDKNGYAEVETNNNYVKLSGLVNKNGEEVLQCKFSDISEDSKVANQYIIMSTLGGKKVSQIYNIETKITYAPKYERVFSYTNDNLWAKQNNKWFLVNKQGNKINNNEYDDIETFYGSELYTVIRNEKSGFVNTEGKEIITLIYKYGRDKGIDIYAATDDNGTTTVFDKKGKQIFQIAGNIGYYSDGLAVAYNTDNLAGKMYRITGFVDTKGIKTIKESISFFESELKEVGYKSIYDIKFKNGVCPMFKNNKWGIIDKAGNQIVPTDYDNFNIENGDLIIMSKGKIGIGKEQYFLFDRKGKKLFEFDCRYISVDKNFYTIIKQNGESGVMTGKGKMVIPFIKDASISFEKYGNFAKKLFWIYKEDERYLIDETGKEYKAK